MTTETWDEQTKLRAESARIRQSGDRLAFVLWSVVAGCLAFTMINVFLLCTGHKVPWQTGWLVDPIMSVSLATVLIGDGVLARHGVRPPGWAQVLKYAAGGFTLALNVWQPVADHDHAGILIHSSVPIMLVLLAEATPVYRRRLAQLADTLDDRANATEREATEQARLTAERGAERTLELERLAAEREAREHEAEMARVREAEANAATERERLKTERETLRSANGRANGSPERKRTDRPMPPRTPAANAGEQADDLARRRTANETAFAAWTEREGTERPMANTELSAMLGISVDAARTQANRWRKANAAPNASAERGVAEAAGSDR